MADDALYYHPPAGSEGAYKYRRDEIKFTSSLSPFFLVRRREWKGQGLS